MYSYIIGKIEEKNFDSIVLENNNIGYIIKVSDSSIYEVGESKKIFLYNHIKEDESSLYGFSEKCEKNFFLTLIKVKGLGPKMALNFLSIYNVEEIIRAINNEDSNFLKKIPKVGDKLSKQIILDLGGKIKLDDEISVDEDIEDVMNALLGLGFKKNEVEKILKNLDKEKSISEKIKEALKILKK